MSALRPYNLVSGALWRVRSSRSCWPMLCCSSRRCPSKAPLCVLIKK